MAHPAPARARVGMRPGRKPPVCPWPGLADECECRVAVEATRGSLGDFYNGGSDLAVAAMTPGGVINRGPGKGLPPP
jgi:hypothetical protein